MKNSIDYYIKVPAKDIHFWCPFFEAFEGMLVLRTPNPPEGEIGILHISVSPDFKEQFEGEVKKHGLEFTNI
ncbi:MAG: hypothetical protein FD145_411 [Candidatus Saganbacteria bacterium]|uniref:DUF4911 domain-containing protein n=1 Tax=Candidatus Saganbacteria bacterium TaxID=2575572 RepID=A0A833NSG8_UNCSA|nr:MAG: hypothetical protein FD145_411 [Candidatus Saganbacteria bacterium]